MLEFQRLNYIEKVMHAGGQKSQRNQTGIIVQQTEVCATNTKREVSLSHTHTQVTIIHHIITALATLFLPACSF